MFNNVSNYSSNINFQNSISNEIRSNEGIYEGQTLNGKPHGYGKIRFPDGGFFKGHWIEGLRNGFGRQVFANQDESEGYWNLEGEFFEGFPHGILKRVLKKLKHG